MPTREVIQLFKQHFGHAPPHVTQAPGRLELIGNHTDYNQGLVMALAVDRYIFMAASPRTDGKIELVSSAFPEKEAFSTTAIEKNPAAPWANYLKGVLLQLRQRGVPDPRLQRRHSRHHSARRRHEQFGRTRSGHGANPAPVEPLYAYAHGHDRSSGS